MVTNNTGGISITVTGGFSVSAIVDDAVIVESKSQALKENSYNDNDAGKRR